MNTNLEDRRKRIELLVKVLGLGIAGFIVAPFVMIAIKGLIGLVIAALIGTGIVYFTPVIAAMFANWRLKAIKAEATRNPVETLQNQLVEKRNALNQFKEQLRVFTGQVMTFADEVKQYVKDQIEDAPVYVEQLGKMKKLLELRKEKYTEAEQMLIEFEETIKRTERKWKMAMSAAAMNEAAGQIAGDVFDKICIETALDSVQQKLNQSFADLEIALLDENKEKKSSSVNLVQPEVQESKSAQRSRIAVA